MCRRVIRTTDGFTAEQLRMMRFHKAAVAQRRRSLDGRIETMTRYANANDMVRYLTEDVPPLEVAPAPTVATAAAPASSMAAPAAVAVPVNYANVWEQNEAIASLAIYDPVRAAGMAAAMPLLLTSEINHMLNAANEAARPIAIQLGVPDNLMHFVCRSASLEAFDYRQRHTTECVGCRNRYMKNDVSLRRVLGLDNRPSRVRLRRCITCAPDLMRNLIDGVVTWTAIVA